MDLVRRPHPVRLSYALHRSAVFSLLFSVFCIAFILSPYWNIADSGWEKLLWLAATILIGVFWSTWSSGALAAAVSGEGVILFAGLLFIVGLINIKPLNSGIPWRGDEYYHIFVVQRFFETITTLYPVFGIFILFVYFSFRKSPWRWLFGILVISGSILFGLIAQIDAQHLLRYPFLSRYLQIIPVLMTYPWLGCSSEIVHRTIPFLSAVLISWLTARSFRRPGCGPGQWRGMGVALLLGVAVGAMPIIYYYSSILYLEMPAVALMLAACLKAPGLLKKELSELVQRPEWYCLLFIGFVKETTIAFIMALVISRLTIRVHAAWKQKHPGGSTRFIARELKVIFCTSAPLFLYLAYRWRFNVTRKVSLDISNLMDPDLYATVLLSFAEQFGPFFLVSIAGGVILFVKKNYGVLGFLAIAGCFTAGIHALDDPAYIGYSRFNLFLTPLLLVSAAEYFNSRTRAKTSLMVLCVLVALNVRLSPVATDGSKKPYWGNPRYDTSEHYYPYRETLQWLLANYPPDKILFSGMYFPYYLHFYFDKFEWTPDHLITRRTPDNETDAKTFEKAHETAVRENCRIIVFHHLDHTLDPSEAGDFVLLHKIENKAHRLSVYRFVGKQ